jgi:hypothetical protein
MAMDSIGVQVGVLLVVLLLLERLASARGWFSLSAAGVPLLTWLIVTALALWCEAVLAFVLIHASLFTLGTEAAGIGLALTTAFLVATPIATAFVVRRATRRASTDR